MKYINEWLTIEDFQRLLAPYEDKSVNLIETLCYIDGNGHRFFTAKIPGTFVENPKGKSVKGVPTAELITLSSTGETIAERIEQDKIAYEHNPIWEEFAQWVKTRDMI